MTKRESELIRQAKSAYLREWRRKNPDRVKEQNDRYWLRRAERELAREEAQEREETKPHEK